MLKAASYCMKYEQCFKTTRNVSHCRKMLGALLGPGPTRNLNRPVFTNPSLCISGAPSHIPAVPPGNSLWRDAGSDTTSWYLSEWP